MIFYFVRSHRLSPSKKDLFQRPFPTNLLSKVDTDIQTFFLQVLV